MSIKVFVESQELEVQSNTKPILLTSLQSAFPGAIQLSFRDSTTNTKRVLPFDGKAFHPPTDGWTTSEEYEVTLGGRNSFPFDSYENASKQLEQTVRTIQSLMAQNEGYIMNELNNVQLTPPSPRERRGSFRSRVATFKNTQDPTNHVDLWLPRRGADELEKQFAELSAVVAGKNAIIENQRKQIQNEKAANEQLERLNSSIKAEAEEWQLKWQSMNTELRLLREMSCNQECAGYKMKLLNAELENVKNSSNTKIQQIQDSLFGVQNEMKETSEKYEQLRQDYDRLIEECREKDKKLEDLRSQLNKLTTELSEHCDQSAKQAECNHELQERLCKENIALAEWSKKLELENKEHEAELERVRRDFDVQHSQLQQSYEDKCQQSANMHQLIESLNKNLIDLSRKYEDLRESFGKTQSTPNSPRPHEEMNGKNNTVLLL
ncbi:hypothetical protein M3Y94_01129100 [Aphelenchoides besseyi]|nr:hypothetical protein M3Y94_01129100 [Aphelenchoides besseyi]KAI6218298.1 TDP43-N domain-containing protein [Aphelenchoides besseyi]